MSSAVYDKVHQSLFIFEKSACDAASQHPAYYARLQLKCRYFILFANNFPWLRSSQPLTARPLCTSCQNKVDLFDVTLVCNYGKKVLLFQTASPEQSLICFYLKISHICIYFQFFLTQLFHCFYVSEHSVETQSQGQPDLIGQSGSLPTSFEMDKMLEFRNGQHIGVVKYRYQGTFYCPKSSNF